MANVYAGVVRFALPGVLLACICAPAYALNFEWGDAQFTFNNTLVLGTAIRLENPDKSIIGKLNNNPDLCPDDCISFTGDPGPNQRLVDAPGAFIGTNFDNGNLNYDKFDFVNGQVRLTSDFIVQYDKVTVKVSGVGFYDQVNSDFTEYHPDTAFQPRHTKRNHAGKYRVGRDYDLLEAFVAFPFEVFDHKFNFSVGEQRVRWGESTFIALGSIDQLNPPDQNRLNFPGSEIANVFEPTGLAVLDTNLSANVALEMVYQYHWERAQAAAAGSFYGTNDIAGGGSYANVSLGQFSEDPNFGSNFKGTTPQLISSASLNVPVDRLRGEPRDQGQGGFKLTWFAENLNGGTELNFYALNYHSRLPYASTIAANRSCIRDRVDLPDSGDITGILGGLGALGTALGGIINGLEQTTGQQLSADGASALIACQGFNGALTSALPGVGLEPLPIGTLRPYLDYPEDIHLFGTSFNTQVGAWSLAGEYVFQPNFPLQVSLVDVIFAGLQPALPDEGINVVLGNIPSARHAIPDYLETRFRGHDVQQGDRIRGYVREKVHQLDLTGIRIFSSSNWIGADQIILLTELGMTYVQDMPGLNKVQFEGGGPNCTHYSPGADGTGAPDGQPDARRLNPTQSTKCFADDFSAGYRIFIRPQYNNLIFGLTFNPIIGFFHDFYGVAPFPAQNFVEKQIQILLGTDVRFNNNLSGQVLYQGFVGSGDRRSLVQDKDNISFSLSYSF